MSTILFILGIYLLIYSYKILLFGFSFFYYYTYSCILILKRFKPEEDTFLSTGNAIKDGKDITTFLQKRINYLGKNDLTMINDKERFDFTQGDNVSICQFIRVAHAQGYRIKLSRIIPTDKNNHENLEEL